GHKSLAVDRLDAPALVWQDGAISENQRLVPDGRLIAYARNRTLDIDKGRWLQMDPNETAIRVIDTLVSHGCTQLFRPSVASVQGRASSTIHFFQYTTSNPVANSDHLGLMLDTLMEASEEAIRWQQAYERGKKALNIARQIVAGVEMESIVMGLAADFVMNKVTGVIGDKIFSVAGKMAVRIKRYAKNFNKEIEIAGRKIKFDSHGFPDFSQFSIGKVPIKMTGDNTTDKRLADLAYKEMGKVRPQGYLWHHSEDLQHMELIPEEVNDEVRHLGGASLWRLIDEEGL
ncbi:MAG: HNH endonuclease, partial [Planctomycetes bacterium]|nr:HNH endonuclease [Planctomycetota bacterium]